MQTMMTTNKRGRNVYDPINMPVTEFKARIKEIQAEMKKKNLNLLLVYGIGPDEYGDSCYITNFVPMLGSSIAILTQNGKLTLFFSGSARGIEYEQATTWVEDFRPSGGDIVADCLKFLKDNQMLAAAPNIGVIGFKDKMASRQLKALYDGCSPSNIIEVDEIIQGFRVIKSVREQDQIKRSARILNQIFNIMTATTFNRLSERQIEAFLDKQSRLEGAEDFRLLIARPQDAKWAFRPVEDQPLRPGDRVIIYASIARERYWADCFRTFEVENSSLKLVEQPALSELYQQIVRGLQPGKTISRFCQETLQELKTRNLIYIPDYGMGQGIGLSPQELPVLSENDSTHIQKGMCFSVRLGVKDESAGAMMIGETFCLDL